MKGRGVGGACAAQRGPPDLKKETLETALLIQGSTLLLYAALSMWPIDRTVDRSHAPPTRVDSFSRTCPSPLLGFGVAVWN